MSELFKDKSIVNHRSELKNQMKELANKVKLVEESSDKKEALRKEPLDLVAYLVKQIKLYNNKIEIKFNSPITKSPDNNQGFFILSTIKELFRIINKHITTTQIKIELYV